MKKLTTEFNEDLYASHDGKPTPPEALENLRVLHEQLLLLKEHIKEQNTGENPEPDIYIVSGYRSPEHNKKVGGVKNSQHMLGKAADIQVEGIKPSHIAEVIRGMMQYKLIKPGGIGRYKTFTHYDIRGRRATWTGNS